MQKLIVLNCPPRSGKDTIAELFVHRDHYKMLSFKDKLINIALMISNVERELWEARYQTHKDVPWRRLGGLTQREYLIKISEEWIKPVHGKSYFGNIIAEDVVASQGVDRFILPDGGFKEEIEPLWKMLGRGVLIIQWEREGCSFNIDSRKWITTYPHITVKVKPNNGTIEEHYQEVKRVIHEHFGEEI